MRERDMLDMEAYTRRPHIALADARAFDFVAKTKDQKPKTKVQNQKPKTRNQKPSPKPKAKYFVL